MLVGSWTIPQINRNSMLKEPLFYAGASIFGLIGFLALEILTSLSFLGDGAKFGAAGLILMLIISAVIGGKSMTIFLSRARVFAIYRILSIETRQEEPTLTITSLRTGES